MAIFHYHISVGTLKSGGAQQRGRYVRRDPREPTDETHDVSSFTMNMPKWASADSDMFWETADAMERKGGLVYREHELALPNELTRDQNESLAREFAAQEFSKFVVEAGLHWKPQNEHAHFQTSEREQDGIDRDRATFFKRYNAKEPAKGGCRKSTRFSGGELRDRAQQKLNVESIRAAWAKMCNEHLDKHGHSARIDHRTNEARGINTPAGVHMGRSAMGLEKRGIVSSRRGHALEIERRRENVISKRLAKIAERDRIKNQRELNSRDQQIHKVGTHPVVQVDGQGTTSKRNATPRGFSHFENLGNRGVGWVSTVPCTLGAVGLSRVHKDGFEFPAYFSSARKLGSAPIAIERSDGFIVVPDVKLSNEEVDAIIQLVAEGGTSIEVTGSEAWCELVSERARVLKIEVKHEFQISEQERQEFERRYWEVQQREEQSRPKVESAFPGFRPGA